MTPELSRIQLAIGGVLASPPMNGLPYYLATAQARGVTILEGNERGLVHLASQVLMLSQQARGSHLHLDEYSNLVFCEVPILIGHALESRESEHLVSTGDPALFEPALPSNQEVQDSQPIKDYFSNSELSSARDLLTGFLRSSGSGDDRARLYAERSEDGMVLLIGNSAGLLQFADMLLRLACATPGSRGKLSARSTETYTSLTLAHQTAPDPRVA